MPGAEDKDVHFCSVSFRGELINNCEYGGELCADREPFDYQELISTSVPVSSRQKAKELKESARQARHTENM